MKKIEKFLNPKKVIIKEELNEIVGMERKWNDDKGR